MAVLLPPPPTNPVSDSFEWREWFYNIWSKTTTTSGISFNSLDFAGSNIASIVTRDHNTLTNIQGGDFLNRFHLTAADYLSTAGNGTTSTKTTTYSITANDGLILCDATSAAFTVTLPTAAGISGKTVSIKKIDSTSNAVTVATSGGQTIDGQATIIIVVSQDCLQVKSNGTNWSVV